MVEFVLVILVSKKPIMNFDALLRTNNDNVCLWNRYNAVKRIDLCKFLLHINACFQNYQVS